MSKSLIAGLCLLASAANAQPPTEVKADDALTFSEVGVTRTFEFDVPISSVFLASDGVAKVVPNSDRLVAITATAPGSVLVFAYGPDGKLVHSMNVVVAGHMIKQYGGPGVRDYVGYVCTDHGCGRADPDIAPPSSQTVGVTHRNSNGDIVSVVKTYP